MKLRTLVILILFPALLEAQQKKEIALAVAQDTLLHKKKDSANVHEVPQIDIYDVAKSIFFKHKSPNKKTDTALTKPVFSAVPAVGYTLTSRLAVTLSGNMAFRPLADSKASTVTASAAYTQNKQFTIPIESNIWLDHDLYNLVGDYRLYKYPQSTFGLGSDSWIGNEDPMDYAYFRFYELLMRRLVPDLYFGAGYILDYHWGIVDESGVKNFPKDSVTAYQAYGASNSSLSTGFTVNLLYDHRDYSINPSRGVYANIQYRDNMKVIGSTRGWQSVIIDLRKYYKFPESSHNVLALWSYNWLVISGHPPFLDLPGTSWDPFSSTGRGYIQGRFRGAQMVYQEAEYRFGITRNGLLGAVVFVNAETFSAAEGTPLEKLQPGYGLGARIKLNKASATNICIDYGFGTQGSKGLFINIAELF
jgi:hypothetical protein